MLIKVIAMHMGVVRGRAWWVGAMIVPVRVFGQTSGGARDKPFPQFCLHVVIHGEMQCDYGTNYLWRW